MSYMNTSPTAIVGTWVERPNVSRTEFVSMCRSLFETESVKNKNNQNVKVNQLTLYRIVTRRLEMIFYTTKNVHLTTRTINFLFFLKHGSIFIYQSQNRFISLFVNLICVDRKSLFTHINYLYK